MNLGIIVALAVLIGVIWFKAKCLKVANDPKTYPEYLLKLCRIENKTQYDFFVIAGEKDKISVYIIRNDWRTYIRTGKLPTYMTDFLDEGKEYIDNHQILI